MRCRAPSLYLQPSPGSESRGCTDHALARSRHGLWASRETNRPASTAGRCRSARSTREFLRRRSNDVIESDRSGRPAELNEAEMPGCLRHRAPLLALSADVQGAMKAAGQRRVVAARPTPDLHVRGARNARVDDNPHSAPDGEPIAKDHAVSFPERERPGGTPGAKMKGPLRLKRSEKQARSVLTGCCGMQSRHGADRHVSWCLLAGHRPGTAGGKRCQDKRHEDHAACAPGPCDSRQTSPPWHRVPVNQAPRRTG